MHPNFSNEGLALVSLKTAISKMQTMAVTCNKKNTLSVSQIGMFVNKKIAAKVRNKIIACVVIALIKQKKMLSADWKQQFTN